MHNTLENPEVTLKDYRIVKLDEIVSEVKQSEEWEETKVSIYEIGLENGRDEGRKEGRLEGVLQTLFQLVQEGILSIADGAVRASLTENDFIEKMNAAEKAKNRQR